MARLPMANDRVVDRWVLWVIQPAPGALEASENDCRPAVVPTPHWSVTDEHDGTVEMLTAPNGGSVVVVVVVASSSVLMIVNVESATGS